MYIELIKPNLQKQQSNLAMNNLDKKITSTNEWMKTDWDARAEVDVKFFVRSIHGQTEKEFWESGIVTRDQILGIYFGITKKAKKPKVPRYQKIFVKKDPKKMKVLEIGCGIGRILFQCLKFLGKP